MDLHLHAPIKQERNEWEEIIDNVYIKNEDVLAYTTDQHPDVKIEMGSIDEELNMDNKQYSNVSFFGQKPYKCNKCNLSFDLKDFGKHKSVCTGELYQCNYCVQYFDTKRHLKHHQKTKCGDKYQCNLCAVCFTTKYLLEDHQKTHIGDKPYQCSHRDKLFAQHSTLVQHKRKHRGERQNTLYKRQNQLKPHNQIHQGDFLNLYHCSHCDKSFKCQVSLDKHMFTHTQQKPYKCSICMKRYSYRDKLEKHQRLICTGKTVKLYHCDHCDKNFMRKISLNKHLKLHTLPGYKTSAVNRCDKDFGQKSTLAAQTTIDTGEKPYQCSYCNKCFRLKSYLDTHLVSHTGHKPYKCNNCDKCFATKRTLERHKKLHPVEKPYQCSYCNKNIDLKNYLDKHLLTHTGQKTYQCNECDNVLTRFGQIKYLKQHKKIDTEDKLYHSGENNESCVQQSKIMDKRKMDVSDLSEEGPIKCMTMQSEIKQKKVELQQDTRPYSNLKISNNLYDFINNAPVAAKNANLNTNEVKDVSDNKSCKVLEKENIQIKVEPKNVGGHSSCIL